MLQLNISEFDVEYVDVVDFEKERFLSQGCRIEN